MNLLYQRNSFRKFRICFQKKQLLLKTEEKEERMSVMMYGQENLNVPVEVLLIEKSGTRKMVFHNMLFSVINKFSLVQ